MRNIWGICRIVTEHWVEKVEKKREGRTDVVSFKNETLPQIEINN